MSAKAISCPLLSNVPPSCGELSSTKSTFASFVLAIAALLEISPLTIVPSTIFAEVTVPSLGVPMFTDYPMVTIKNVAPEAGAEANIMSAPLIANPSLGEVPLLGF